MIKKTRLWICLILAVSIATPSALAQEAEQFCETGPMAVVLRMGDMFSSPRGTADELCKIPAGSQVAKLGETGDWALVSYGGVLGYIASNNLSLKEISLDNEAITTTVLNVRKGPGMQYAVIGALRPKDKVSVVGKSGNWAMISYQNSAAYVFYKYLRPGKEKTVYAAAEGVGLPWGTNGTLLLSFGDPVQLVGESGDWYKVRYEGNAAYVKKELLTFENPRTVSIPPNAQFATLRNASRLYMKRDHEQPIKHMWEYRIPQRVMILENAGEMKKISVYGYELYAFSYDLYDYTEQYSQQQDKEAIYNFKLSQQGALYREAFKEDAAFGKFGYDNADNTCVLYFKKGSSPDFDPSPGFKLDVCNFSMAELKAGADHVHRIAKQFGWREEEDYHVWIDEQRNILSVDLIENATSFDAFKATLLKKLPVGIVDIGLLLA